MDPANRMKENTEPNNSAMVCPPTIARSRAVAPLGLMKMPTTLEPNPAAMAADDRDLTNSKIIAMATKAKNACKKYCLYLWRNLGFSK